jgi:hypothetical protein
MDLVRWRSCKAHENYDAIATWISALGVGVEIGFPVINGPNVSCLIDDHGRLTHHWYQTGRRWWQTVQWLAVMQ